MGSRPSLTSSPCVSSFPSPSPHWASTSTTGECTLSSILLCFLLGLKWLMGAVCCPWRQLVLTVLSPQVSCQGLRRGHLHILCWHDLCCRRHHWTLQQNCALVLHSTDFQLPILCASALPLCPLPQTPHPTVSVHTIRKNALLKNVYGDAVVGCYKQIQSKASCSLKSKTETIVTLWLISHFITVLAHGRIVWPGEAPHTVMFDDYPAATPK